MANAMKVIGGLVMFVTLLFVLELVGLEWMRFFKPRRQAIEREVFEETKSYTHGKIQDLAKYYVEYQKEDEEGKEQIKGVIQMQFASFNADTIDNRKLRAFLIEAREF